MGRLTDDQAVELVREALYALYDEPDKTCRPDVATLATDSVIDDYSEATTAIARHADAHGYNRALREVRKQYDNVPHVGGRSGCKCRRCWLDAKIGESDG